MIVKSGTLLKSEMWVDRDDYVEFKHSSDKLRTLK